MSLSDNIFILDKRFNKLIAVGKVKEFIKKRNGLLQEYLDGKIPLIIFLERIDKLAGDELI